MEISVNDTFKTKEEMINSLTEYANSIHFKFNITETPRTLSFICKGRQEFSCDASIVTSYKKKENCFIIKRMKLTHKCPIANNEFASTDEFLRNEILMNIADYKNTRIGEIVSILYNRSIRVSYNSVYNIIKGKGQQQANLLVSRIDMYKPESAVFYNSDYVSIEDMTMDDESFQRFHEYNHLLEDFCTEFSTINPDKVDINYYGKMVFYKIKEYINILYPLIEIKYYRRKSGLAIFGVLYDPLSEPIIYTCLVSEDVSDKVSFKYFFKNTKFDKYIIEYDSLLIKIMDDLSLEYFVKTRDVCRHIYNNDGIKENLEVVWNIYESRFIKSKSTFTFLNINNLPECDLDFINYGVYALPFFECVNAIQKLSTDNLKIKKRFTKQDPKSLFGYNVINRVERNESTVPKEDCKIDLENGTCECGMYQDILIPCVHVCKYLREQRKDPFLYVSNLYSKEQYLRLDEILPVMSVNVKVQSDRFNFKKGPGRPKKSFGKEMEIVVE
ncbi:hypothetical protein P3W45_001648 [Vairimorpha bombi]